MSYLTGYGTRNTPQSEPMRSDQVENDAGGFVWQVDCWSRLRRFLILGSEGGSYYTSERKLTLGNIQALADCVATDGLRTVNEIVAVSDGGRAPKNDPALYALAYVFSHGDTETKLAAGKALPKVARIGTHLYHFVAYAETMRGWGRMMRKAVSEWYERNPEQLALQAIKYRQRDGWSHRDLLRLAHPSTGDEDTAAIFQWITHGSTEVLRTEHAVGFLTTGVDLIDAFEMAQRSDSPAQTANLIREYRLPREALRTEHLNDVVVWKALLEQGMPMHALTRNLANMTRLGVFEDAEMRKLVVAQLGEQEPIRRSRLHPMTLLVALRTYASGRGMRGTNTWAPLPTIIDALDAAFYLAFDNVESTGKPTLLALDISGSMGGSYGRNEAMGGLTPREICAAMCLVTLHAEQDVEVVGFSHNLVFLPLSRRQRLDDAVNTISGLPFGTTDCALPMIYAKEAGKRFESFAVYTDNETWSGRIHPKQALDQYRQATGLNARVAVVGIEANDFSIADPNDAGMMDVVGFDTSAPAVMADFFAGRV